MTAVTFEIFGAAFICAGILVFIIRRLLKINDIRLELVQKRLEATELRMMKLDAYVAELKTHFDKRCDAMDYQLKEINRICMDINLRFAILETRVEERSKLITAQPAAIPAKRPYRRRNQEKAKEGTF